MTEALDTHRLARLNAEAVLAYERAMNTVLADPERLKALYDSGFWKGEHQERLQALVETANQLIVSAGAAVILVDGVGQRSAAATTEGLDEPLDASYCKYVVSEKHPFGVESAESHSLVCTSRATTEKGVRAYLGVPLCAPNGLVLGSFCVWSLEDRTWTEADVLILTNLAATAAALETHT